MSCNLVSKIEDRKIPGNAPLEQQYGIQEIAGDDLASTQASVTQAVRKWKQGQLAAKVRFCSFLIEIYSFFMLFPIEILKILKNKKTKKLTKKKVFGDCARQYARIRAARRSNQSRFRRRVSGSVDCRVLSCHSRSEGASGRHCQRTWRSHAGDWRRRQ